MEVSVRLAVAEDEDEVVALWRACQLVVSYNDPSADFRSAIFGACSCVLVHEDEAGKINGAAMAGFDGHRGWLYYVAVARSAQGTGLGRRMVAAGEQWLRDRGAAKVQLLIRESNAGVIAFYERMGFEVTPRVVMGKWLKN